MSLESLLGELGSALAVLNSARQFVSMTGASSGEGPKSQQENFRATEAVRRLPAETLRIAEDLAAKLRKLRTDLKSYDVNLERSVKELEQDVNWWHLRRNQPVKIIVPGLRDAHDSLEVLFDNLIAVAQCHRVEKLIVQSYEDAEKQRKNIGDITSRDRPIGSIINDAETFVSEVLKTLGDTRPGGGR